MPQGLSRLVRKISPRQGFDPRSVQPVMSRYTDCAIPAHSPKAITSLLMSICQLVTAQISSDHFGNSSCAEALLKYIGTIRPWLRSNTKTEAFYMELGSFVMICFRLGPENLPKRHGRNVLCGLRAEAQDKVFLI